MTLLSHSSSVDLSVTDISDCHLRQLLERYSVAEITLHGDSKSSAMILFNRFP